MEKFDKSVVVDVIKELANEVCANYATYFENHNIDETIDKENQFVKAYWEVSNIELERAYECNSEQEYEKLKNQIIKARELLNASE